jgi:ribonucleoside-diphosphate reductase alpha chain
MDYEVPEVEKAAKMRRTLGIGFSDTFHDLAKNKQFYNTRDGRQFTHDRVELAAYHMIRTSMELAKEKGPCQLFSDTKYSEGIFPRDTYKKTVDELCDGDANPFNLDWEALREDVKTHGMRHSTLMANAPFGSSAMVSNSTSGIEPPRKLVNTKKGDIKIVPDYIKYGKYYTTAWSPEFNNVDYFKYAAIFQKFICQSISTNQYTNLIVTGGKVKKSRLIAEFLTAYRYGLKTLYYSNIISNTRKDGEDEDNLDLHNAIDDGESVLEEIDDEDSGPKGCASGACHV